MHVQLSSVQQTPVLTNYYLIIEHFNYQLISPLGWECCLFFNISFVVLPLFTPESDSTHSIRISNLMIKNRIILFVADGGCYICVCSHQLIIEEYVIWEVQWLSKYVYFVSLGLWNFRCDTQSKKFRYKYQSINVISIQYSNH